MMHDIERNLRGRDQRLTQMARKAHLVALSSRNSPADSSEPASDKTGTRRRMLQGRELILRRLRRFAAAAILMASVVVWLIDVTT